MMAVYPAQLTSEEKALKKKYQRLQEKRKQVRKLHEKPSPSKSTSSGKPLPKDTLKPKEAKEVAKKLLESGKLTIHKKAPIKKSGFKRVGELPGQGPPSKKPNTGNGPSASEQPSKPKLKAADVKALYSKTFVKASNPSEELERTPIPKRQQFLSESSQERLKQQQQQPQHFTAKDCTVHVGWHQPYINEEAITTAFKRFGGIQTVTMDKNKSTSFVTFTSPSIAHTAIKEMNGGMIRGSDVRVEVATRENGYVELTAEAAKNPWAVIAAGRDLNTDSPKKGRSETQRHKEVVTYEADF